jgi:hypothetical protein
VDGRDAVREGMMNTQHGEEGVTGESTVEERDVPERTISR